MVTLVKHKFPKGGEFLMREKRTKNDDVVVSCQQHHQKAIEEILERYWDKFGKSVTQKSKKYGGQNRIRIGFTNSNQAPRFDHNENAIIVNYLNI